MARSVWFLGEAALCGFVWALAGCGEVFVATGGAGGAGGAGAEATGSAATAGGGGGAGAGGTTSNTGPGGGQLSCLHGEECRGCLGKSCPSVVQGCQENASCLALVCCANACGPGDFDCTGNCINQSPGGYADALLMADCAFDHCLDKCAVKLDLQGCQPALLAHCEEKANECHQTQGCQAYYNCIESCDGDCNNCELSADETGRKAGQALKDCRDGIESAPSNQVCALL
jgi:hypothetical protein